MDGPLAQLRQRRRETQSQHQAATVKLLGAQLLEQGTKNEGMRNWVTFVLGKKLQKPMA